MKRKKKSSKVRKPIGITRIPKGNIRKLKPGVAFMFGSKTRPRFSTKRFKTVKSANVYARKKGWVR